MDNPQNEINDLSDQIPIRIKRISGKTKKTGYSYTQTAQKNIDNDGLYFNGRFISSDYSQNNHHDYCNQRHQNIS